MHDASDLPTNATLNWFVSLQDFINRLQRLQLTVSTNRDCQQPHRYSLRGSLVPCSLPSTESSVTRNTNPWREIKYVLRATFVVICCCEAMNSFELEACWTFSSQPFQVKKLKLWKYILSNKVASKIYIERHQWLTLNKLPKSHHLNLYVCRSGYQVDWINVTNIAACILQGHLTGDLINFRSFIA